MRKPSIIFVLVLIATAIGWGSPTDAFKHRAHIDLDLRFSHLNQAIEELADWVGQLDEELHPGIDESKLGDLESEISELQSKMGDLESTIGDLKGTLELQTNQIADLESQISDLQKKKPR